MKKLGVMILTACVVAAVAAGPAYATPAPTPADAQELCRSMFSAESCTELAEEWATALEARDAASIEVFADQLVAHSSVANAATQCELIFSEEVCASIREVGGTIWDIVRDPPTIDDIRYIILWLADCVVHQTCIAPSPGAQRSAADVRVCREVFSDTVCDKVEDPVGTVVWLYDTVLRCYLDPECTPTPDIYCNDLYCIGPGGRD